MIQPGEIHVKNKEVFRGLVERNYTPLLINIICAIADRSGVVITESYREKRHRNDLHGTQPVRAIDIRSWCYDNPYYLADWVNNTWSYDSSRPDKQVALLHDSGQGMHFHIQVCNRTQRRVR